MSEGVSENFLFDEPKRIIRLGEELKFSQPERAISGNYAAAGDFSLELSFDRSKESG
ncbi:MAG: hypothetical protein K1X85_09460 [Ignavibacteria bacterium]|nr:hypothetical protein [Ignavibacteria bacterium]